MSAGTMSPPIAATWEIRRTRLPLVRRRCPDCRSRTAQASGKFRVNASAKLLDVWLLLHCTGCERTSKVTVIERSATIAHHLLVRFENNDPDLIAQVLLDPATAHRNHFALDWGNSWEVVTDPDASWQHPGTFRVTFADPIPLRPARLIAAGLRISRNKAEELLDTRVIELSGELGTKIRSTFEFTTASVLSD
ncbi:DUF1062 domain-containing protein [Kineosporia sp. NBRC 101731]|uniref:DUF1062 domain-containing protein n=1 Tax=Kineosporia sp. NBRC 101731 TaxID=3032199 RepID=UPI0024A5A3CB|nr:DUF1062 domain-containing protein [Kineosporia sp. NBRC 101731]GLY28377.1 hypothetical protein Kisp02_17420 [Kineosporia sp. NBRC 101731]